MTTTETSELEWELEATRKIDDLTRSLAQLECTPPHDAVGTCTAVREIDSVTTAGLCWTAENPGWDLELERQVARVFASQSLALHAVTVAIKRSRSGNHVFDDINQNMDESMLAVASALNALRSRLPIS